MLRLPADVFQQMVGHAYDGLPDEACGLFAAPPSSPDVALFVPCPNAAASSRIYSISGQDYMKADRAAEDAGLQLVGVMHSHTHTDAYPSPTDVAQAPDPAWHYVIVSLRDLAPTLRSYRIVDGVIAEEPVALLSR